MLIMEGVTTLGPSPVGFPPKQQGLATTNEVLFGNMLYFSADRTTAPLLTLITPLSTAPFMRAASAAG